MRSQTSPLLLLLALVPACTSMPENEQSERILVHASALTKLSTAMESLFRYGHPLPGQTQAELLVEGTRHDPALLTNLGDYTIKVSGEDRHAVVLVCTSAGDRALLEDAGCTAKMDVHHWKQANVPCEFSVSVAAVCAEH
jgi:hypothetical protein